MRTMAESKENSLSIDNIPYEILHHIVSLIPLKEAVRTIILSSSWKCLWVPIQMSLNINYDQITSQESGHQINQIISSLLNSYGNSYKILHLSFLETKSLNEEKETLFLKAVKGVEKELYISFYGENTKFFALSIDLPLCRNDDHFSSLKTIHLLSITSIAEGFLLALFSGCRNLETLSLEKCTGLEYVELQAHDLLQNFEVLDCENMERVTISSAPNLGSFVYRGALVKIELKDVPELCDVTLNFKGTSDLCDYNEFDSQNVVPLLAFLKDVEVLTLSGWLLEWLSTRGVIFDEFGIKFDKLKKLSWMDCCMNTQKRESLACFLSITPSLETLFIKVDEKCSTILTPDFHQTWPQAWTDTLIETSNDFQLKYLKIVNFSGFKIKEENQILVSLMDLLLKKAIAVEKLSVRGSENKILWRVAKVPQSHLKKTTSSSSTRSCYSSKSSLILSLNKRCCFQLTPASDI